MCQYTKKSQVWSKTAPTPTKLTITDSQLRSPSRSNVYWQFVFNQCTWQREEKPAPCVQTFSVLQCTPRSHSTDECSHNARSRMHRKDRVERTLEHLKYTEHTPRPKLRALQMVYQEVTEHLSIVWHYQDRWSQGLFAACWSTRTMAGGNNASVSLEF